MKESKRWEMSGARWHRRMDGWRESNERRGRRAERKKRRLEGKAGHRRGWSSMVGGQLWLCCVDGLKEEKNLRMLSDTKHSPAVIVMLSFLSYPGKHTDVKSFCQKKAHESLLTHDALHQKLASSAAKRAP